MIEWLKNWITTICIAVIFITCIELILPNNKMKKYSKFVLGLILIVVLLNPIIKLFNKDDINCFINNSYNDINNNSEIKLKEYKETNRDKVIQVFDQKLQIACEKILKKKFPENNYKVDVKSNIDKDSDKLNISSISVGMTEKGTISKVKKIEIDVNSDLHIVNNKSTNSKNEKIRTYLSDELKLPKENIVVYELKGGVQ